MDIEKKVMTEHGVALDLATLEGRVAAIRLAAHAIISEIEHRLNDDAYLDKVRNSSLAAQEFGKIAGAATASMCQIADSLESKGYSKETAELMKRLVRVINPWTTKDVVDDIVKQMDELESLGDFGRLL